MLLAMVSEERLNEGVEELLNASNDWVEIGICSEQLLSGLEEMEVGEVLTMGLRLLLGSGVRGVMLMSWM